MVEAGFLRPGLTAGLDVAAVLDVGTAGRVATLREVVVRGRVVVVPDRVAVVLGRVVVVPDRVAVVLGRVVVVPDRVVVVLGRVVAVPDRVVVVLGRVVAVPDRVAVVLGRVVAGAFAVVVFEAGNLETVGLATGLAAALVVAVVVAGFLLTAVTLGIADLVASGRVRGDESVVFGLAAAPAPPSAFLVASVTFGLLAAVLVSFFASISRLL